MTITIETTAMECSQCGHVGRFGYDYGGSWMLDCEGPKDCGSTRHDQRRHPRNNLEALDSIQRVLDSPRMPSDDRLTAIVATIRGYDDYVADTYLGLPRYIAP